MKSKKKHTVTGTPSYYACPCCRADLKNAEYEPFCSPDCAVEYQNFEDECLLAFEDGGDFA